MSEKRGADWISWILQFVVGFIAGSIVGYMLVLKLMSRGRGLLPDANISTFLWGIAITTGAVATRYGDKLWMGDAYRVLPADEPEHDRWSLLATLLVGIIGVAMVCHALFTRR